MIRKRKIRQRHHHRPPLALLTLIVTVTASAYWSLEKLEQFKAAHLSVEKQTGALKSGSQNGMTEDGTTLQPGTGGNISQLLPNSISQTLSKVAGGVVQKMLAREGVSLQDISRYKSMSRTELKHVFSGLPTEKQSFVMANKDKIKSILGLR